MTKNKVNLDFGKIAIHHKFVVTTAIFKHSLNLGSAQSHVSKKKIKIKNSKQF
jgi:hypothetical protein